MGAASSSIAFSTTLTDTEFRTMLALLSDNMTTFGLTKTSDTGQINTTTVTWPGTNNTDAGYEVRQMNGGITLKLWYGRGSGTQTTRIGWQIGTGSDGSGNLTGAIGTRVNGNLNPSASGNTQQLHISATADYLNIFGWTTTSGTPQASSGSLFCIERTADMNRTFNSNGVAYYTATSSSALVTGYLPLSGTPPTADTIGNCFPPYEQTTGLHSSGDAAVYPFHVFGVGECLPPLLSIVGGFAAQFSDGAQYTVSVRGTNQEMVKMPTNTQPLQFYVRGSKPAATNFGLLVRYE